MNTTPRTLASLLAGLTLATVFSTSALADQQRLLFAPGEPYGRLPQFGFSSTNNGFGERIQFVRNNSRASRLGLEQGDTILSLNGISLNYRGSWTDALSHAYYEDGGQVRLRIRDVRTGQVFTRQLFVGNGGNSNGGGNGPVQHYKSNGKFQTNGKFQSNQNFQSNKFTSNGFHFHD